MRFVKYVIFVLLLAYIPMWVQTNLLLGSFGHGKTPITAVEDRQLTDMIRQKTGVEVKTITISESERPFGMMVGIPGRPQLILSRALYRDFSPDELQYVVLHETGHYAFAHSLKELGLGLALLVVGVLMLRRTRKGWLGVVVAIVLGFVFGVTLIQQGKYNELQADAYSLSHMDNPEGMITATERFRSYYGVSYTQTNNKVFQWLFYRGNPYDNRIKMAKAEIER